MVKRRAVSFFRTVRLEKRREGLGVQTLLDRSNLQLSGCRAFVLDGARCFHDKVQGRTDGHPQGPKLKRNRHRYGSQTAIIPSLSDQSRDAPCGAKLFLLLVDWEQVGHDKGRGTTRDHSSSAFRIVHLLGRTVFSDTMRVGTSELQRNNKRT